MSVSLSRTPQPAKPHEEVVHGYEFPSKTGLKMLVNPSSMPLLHRLRRSTPALAGVVLESGEHGKGGKVVISGLLPPEKRLLEDAIAFSLANTPLSQAVPAELQKGSVIRLLAKTMFESVAKFANSVTSDADAARVYQLVETFEASVADVLQRNADKKSVLKDILSEAKSFFSDASVDIVIENSMRKYGLQPKRPGKTTPFELVPTKAVITSTAPQLTPTKFSMEKFQPDNEVPQLREWYKDPAHFARPGGVTLHKVEGCGYCTIFVKNYGDAFAELEDSGVEVRTVGGPIGPRLFLTLDDGVHEVNGFQSFYLQDKEFLTQKFFEAGAESRSFTAAASPFAAVVSGDGPALSRARSDLEGAVLTGATIRLELDPKHRPGASAVISHTGRDANLLNLVQTTTPRQHDSAAIEMRMKALTLAEGQVFTLDHNDELSVVTPALANGFVTHENHVLAPTTTKDGTVFYMGAPCKSCATCSGRGGKQNEQKTVELRMANGEAETLEVPKGFDQALTFSAQTPCLVTDLGEGCIRFTKAGDMARRLVMSAPGVYEEMK